MNEEIAKYIQDMKEQIDFFNKKENRDKFAEYIKFLRKEIERLNNIINELEKYCNICVSMNFNMNNNEISNQIVEDYSNILNRLQKLKGVDKE